MTEHQFVYIAWLASIIAFFTAAFDVVAWVKATAVISLMVVAIVGLNYE